MYGIATLARLNAANHEADRIMAAHGHTKEARATYGAPKAPTRDLLFSAFPESGEALLAPASPAGLQWLHTHFPEHPHDGLAVVLTNPDDVAAALAAAEVSGLRVN